MKRTINTSIFLFILSTAFISSCVTKVKLVPVDKEIIVKDTVYQKITIRDTFRFRDTIVTTINVPQYVFVPKYVDTCILAKYIYVTKEIFIHDTIKVRDEKLINELSSTKDSLSKLKTEISGLKKEYSNLQEILKSTSKTKNVFLWWLLAVLVASLTTIFFIYQKFKSK